MNVKTRSAAGSFQRSLSYLKPHRASVLAIVALTVAGAVVSVLEPLLLKYVIDGLADRRGPQVLLTGVVGVLALNVVRELLVASTNYRTWRTRLDIHFRLLDATIGRLHALPLSFHREHGVGRLMTRLDRSIQGFLTALSEIAFNALPAVVYLLIALVIMFRLDWRLALLVTAFAPLPALLAVRTSDRHVERERSLLERWARIYGRFNEVLSGIVTVRSFAMEDVEKQRFLRDVHGANRVVLGGVADDSRLGALQNLVIALARLSAIALGGWLVLTGRGTLGTLIAFLGYLTGLFGPVQGLTGVYKTLRRASVSADEIYSILDTPDPLHDAPDAQDAGVLRGKVELRGVSFAYKHSEPVLQGLDLTVEPGERIAVVGPSGSGKTTLMALLQRFHDPTLGSVLIDGRDLRSLKQASIRRQIGVVLQDPILFDDSVMCNIAYGKPHADQTSIVQAARAAQAHEFIMRLPQGYESPVGERGNRLSAGERQRIAIARALLKDPPILILDEATSALDAESEELVQRALEELVRGRTTFVIAHRLATVVGADRIVVLKDGRIAECGKHADLLAAGGYYASLVHKQTRGLLLDEAA